MNKANNKKMMTMIMKRKKKKKKMIHKKIKKKKKNKKMIIINMVQSLHLAMAKLMMTMLNHSKDSAFKNKKLSIKKTKLK